VVPISPAAAATKGAAVSPAKASAVVAGAPIAKSSYQHWVSVAKALGGTRSARHLALGFLITSEWVLREAAARHITVSDAEVKQRFDQLVRKSFSKPGSLQAFLAKAHETEADLLARIKVEMLKERIEAQVAAGKKGAQRKIALHKFAVGFQKHWKSVTNCKPGLVMEDCKQYKGAPENLTPAASPPAAASGEAYSPPGGFSISSPEFERNGQIPLEYLCSNVGGQGISPALNWDRVPSGAAELVLFVIDTSSANSDGGQRWIVAGIDPSSKGVAAGHVPPGGIVGTNTAGKAAYSPICPAKGKSDTIEFVMYALKSKIKVSPGFQPTEAESQYGPGKLLLGQAALTYGTAAG
jgi:phosphatidylethanolamine-binding protein (PEBP) family uncharacterized protein